jgi:tetratricopeptide (TPR) repeat protein
MTSTNPGRVLAATVLGLAAAGGLGGCNQTPRSARDAIVLYQVGNYAQAAAELKPATAKLDENYVLNNCRYGSCALGAGQFDEAEAAFYSAYKVINSSNTNDAGRQLSATIVYEGVKVWKGEPFEQAMADYYLGVLYLMKHDYGNARAAFQNSLFSLWESADKDDKEHRQRRESRFALGYFGLGLCNLRLARADLAEQNFEKAQDCDRNLAPLIAEVKKPGVNGLVIVDAGLGPLKKAHGWYNEEVYFAPTPAQAGPVFQPLVAVDGRAVTRQDVAYNTVDTLAMAQDRLWMDIDTVKKVKAVVGTGAMAAGVGMAAYGAHERDEGFVIAGLATAALGAGLAASSQSDVRYWEMLPRTVYIIPVALPPGEHDVTVQVGPWHNAVHMVQQPPQPGVTADAVFYFRAR